jgi:hypothetical protein
MKSLLRFFLLFALIIIGKVAKEPTSFADMTKAARIMDSTPVSPVSLFRQPVVQSGAPAGEFQLWHPTVSSTEATPSFQ